MGARFLKVTIVRTQYGRRNSHAYRARSGIHAGIKSGPARGGGGGLLEFLSTLSAGHVWPELEGLLVVYTGCWYPVRGDPPAPPRPPFSVTRWQR